MVSPKVLDEARAEADQVRAAQRSNGCFEEEMGPPFVEVIELNPVS
jgi:hypothetical protein